MTRLSIHETVKTENGKILFHMDAHGPPFPKKMHACYEGMHETINRRFFVKQGGY